MQAAGKQLAREREIPRPDRLTAPRPVRAPDEVPADEWEAGLNRMMAGFAMGGARG